MISRRIIRTKVLHVFYAHLHSSDKDKQITQSEKELFYSIQKSYDLYHLLLALSGEIVKLAEERIERGLNKQLPTYEDLNPNRRFVNNPVLIQIKESDVVNGYLESNKLTWINHIELTKRIFTELSSAEFFKNYIAKKESTLKEDKRFVSQMFEEIILQNEELQSELEEMSIYWNDDFDFVVSMVIKTIRKIKKDVDFKVLPLFKDAEDEKFTKTLFRKALLNHGENRAALEGYTQNWEVDRIATMDTIIMELALTELMEFPSIPVKVTLNEYIDLAKYYSTNRSSIFVNGVLDRMVKEYTESKKIQKAGRGLN